MSSSSSSSSGTGAGARRRARWYALQVMFALDVNMNQDYRDALRLYAGDFELEIDERAIEYATEVVAKAVEHRDEIDATIQDVSRNWRLERMSRVDRNILRLATCELTYFTDVPAKVAINEAVELAKRFGTSDSAAFVNGIVDRIAHQTRGDGAG